MKAYPDTSFLCAYYLQGVNTETALAYFDAYQPPLRISWMVQFEFVNGVRFEAFRNSADRTKGLSLGLAIGTLLDIENDISAGLVEILEFDSWEVRRIADELSEKYSTGGGHRSFDVLHVATAIHFGASEFLTFDGNQRKLAEAVGLRVPFLLPKV